MSANRLGTETSPYLLQHKDNPVHWQPWGEGALAQAKESGRPILLSVGYAACHWCHVMAHESFEDPATASVMNALFVNIKVDREERPDLDSIYQTALAIMGEQGGWPLTVFLTPEAEPFFGGTYFPPTARYGRPGFTEVLKAISNAYHQDKEKVKTNVAAVRQALERISKPEGEGTLTPAVLDRAAASALGAVDPLHGGTHGSPKFPQPSFFKFLWHAYRRTRSPMFREGVTLTLDHLCQGGIYDHAGGGFARYSTDEVWLVPHFEKMLYDNALLIELLTYAWIETRSPLYTARVAETIGWALRDMTSSPAQDGSPFGFVSAYDADSEGEEGKYYVWAAAEIDAVLGPDAVLFKATYDVTPEGNWEGHTILNRSVADGLADAATEETLARARAKLLKVRAQRVAPQRDDKVLTDWNGLMIAALARAGAAFGRPEWIAAATQAYAFVRENLFAGGRLQHTWCAGQARHPAVLEDHANMSRAALVLAEVTGRPSFVADAEAWVAAADAYHWDAEGGGYFLAASDTPNLIVRTKTAQDNAQPSGNGTMLEVLARLYHLTGTAAYRARAEELARLFSTQDTQQLMHRPVLMMGFEILARATQVVVVGPESDADARALIDSALRFAPPTLVLSRVDPGTALPAGHPATGKGAIGGKSTAYVCVGETCSLPIHDAPALEAALQAL